MSKVYCTGNALGSESEKRREDAAFALRLFHKIVTADLTARVGWGSEMSIIITAPAKNGGLTVITVGDSLEAIDQAIATIKADPHKAVL